VGGVCWSSANGVAGGGCGPGTQCGPWLPDGGTWDGAAPWYCVANPALTSGASCDYSIKNGPCAPGLSCCNGQCASSSSPCVAPTAAPTTPGSSDCVAENAVCKSSDPALASVPAQTCCSGSCQAETANPSGDKFCRADNYPFEDQEAANSCKSSPPDLAWNHAMEMIRLVIDEADTRGMALSICIRDRHDNLVAHIRMKNALLGSVDLSCMKARTSALFPFPSVAIAAFEPLQFTNGIISPIEGGLPLMTSSGVSAGSIGVSGAPTGAEDAAIAKVAVDQIDFILDNYW